MTQIFLFFDCIALTRYIYIFWLKNPAAFKDDFWCRVAVPWIKAFSFLITGVWYFLAGKIYSHSFIDGSRAVCRISLKLEVPK